MTAENHELTKRLETLTKDAPAWDADMRARVEAKVALEQAEGLWHVLEEWSWWRRMFGG